MIGLPGGLPIWRHGLLLGCIGVGSGTGEQDVDTAQAALAGWAWAHARESGSPWLRRTGVIVGGGILIFLQWYLGRYLGTPRLGLNGTLAFVVGFVVLGIAVPWIGDWRRRRRLTSRTSAV